MATTDSHHPVMKHEAVDVLEVTTRSDLSLFYRVLRLILKPLRPRLVQTGKPWPAGSPKLDPPKKRNVVITESQCEDVWMYRIRAVKETPPRHAVHTVEEVSGAHGAKREESDDTAVQRRRRRHCVYYFVGGGFQSPPSGEHWRFVAQLAQDLAGTRSSVTFPGNKRGDGPESDVQAELVLVSYPLAPASPAAESLPILKKWLATTLDEAAARDEKVSLMGDSSGGNIALSLGFWAVQEYRPSTAHRADDKTTTSESNTIPLSSLFAICPAVDMTNENPDIPEVNRLDPILTMELTTSVAQAWTGHTKQSGYPPRDPVSRSDPSVSPLLHSDSEFHRLAQRGVHVHGVVATHDVLSPDALKFMEKCRKNGVRGKWLVWQGQMHCFPLAGGGHSLGIREGKHARRFVENALREDARRDRNSS